MGERVTCDLMEKVVWCVSSKVLSITVFVLAPIVCESSMPALQAGNRVSAMSFSCHLQLLKYIGWQDHLKPRTRRGLAMGHLLSVAASFIGSPLSQTRYDIASGAA